MVEEYKFEYDFAISFAGKNRETANSLEKFLTAGGAHVFYDRNFEANLLGKNFQQEWKKICRASRYVIVIISEYYIQGEWTQFEFEVAIKEALRRETEFILPLRLDSTEVVGLPYTTSHIDLRNRNISEVAITLLSKLKIETGLTLRKSATDEYKKRLEYFTELITSLEISKFNEYRKNNNYAVMDLRHLAIGGDWQQNGKFGPLRLDNIILKKSFLAQADLAGIKIKNSDLSGSTYYLANLSEARFEDVNFSNSFMQQADVYDCFMRNCDFSNCNFSIANLFDAHFSSCCLYHTNFSYSKCNNSSFVKCLLYDVYFNNANLADASFDSSLLVNIINFKNLNCLNADFRNSLINNIKFVEYLRNHGAKNVPDAITDIEEIRRRLMEMSCTQRIIDKIVQNLLALQ